MDQRFHAFILTAENLSMSKAAQLSWVSHQCISSQIRSLEKEYNTLLFVRKPTLSLTPAGESLLQMLYDIRLIENAIPAAISDNGEEPSGKISIGIPESRYNICVPPIVTKVYSEHPGISLSIQSNFSAVLEHSVETGLVDMAIVAQQPCSSDLETIRLITDQFYVLISKKLYRTIFAELPDFSDSFDKKLVPEDISRIPIIMFPPQSRVRMAFESYYRDKGITLKPVFESNRNDVFEKLARVSVGACLIPHMFLPEIIRANSSFPEEKQLLFFPLDMNRLQFESLDVMLLYSKVSRLTPAKRAVIQSIINIFSEIDSWLESNLEKNYKAQELKTQL